MKSAVVLQSFETRPDEVNYMMRCENDRGEEYVEEQGWHVALGGYVDEDVK